MYRGTEERSDRSPPAVSVSARSPTQSGKSCRQQSVQEETDGGTDYKNQLDEMTQIMLYYYA